MPFTSMSSEMLVADVDRLLMRAELRLEQRRLHSELLQRYSCQHDADERAMRRSQDAVQRLQLWRAVLADKRRGASTHPALLQEPGFQG